MTARCDVRRMCIWALVWWGIAAPGHAQVGAAALSGNIIDQADASVAGAVITATEVGTRLTRATVTATDGGYFIPSLPPGVYRVRVELSGFRPLTRDGIRLATGESVRVDLQLEVGGLGE